jgi:hippurate hydrolase
MSAWRQDLHAHPELGFDEHRTSEFVAGKLSEFGCEVHRNIGKTGVVGVLRTGIGLSIGLRVASDFWAYLCTASRDALRPSKS